MKIIKASAVILRPEILKGCLERIEFASRLSHRSETDLVPERTNDFIKKVVIDRCDYSVIEHESISVLFEVDRGITHELVRHRVASYTQESTRFVNYKKKIPPSFIYPKPGVSCEYCLSGVDLQSSDFGYEEHEAVTMMHHGNVKVGDSEDDNFKLNRCAYEQHWLRAIHRSEYEYQQLLSIMKEDGKTPEWTPQEARSVFPNALASKIQVTMNLRSWRHFFQQRTTKLAHPQMLEVTVPLLAEFKSHVPVLFDDIIPFATQAFNSRLGR